MNALKSSAALSFTPVEIQLLEASVQRGGATDRETIAIDLSYQVVKSAFKAGGTELEVTTQYDVILTPPTEMTSTSTELDLSDTDDHNLEIGRVTTRYKLILEASRVLQSDDGPSGRLNPAQDLANELLHPYHRNHIARLTTEIELLAFELPLTWEGVLTTQRVVNGLGPDVAPTDERRRL